MIDVNKLINVKKLFFNLCYNFVINLSVIVKKIFFQDVKLIEYKELIVMIKPINFTGIKNIAAAYVPKTTYLPKSYDNKIGSRLCMNMELTDDDENKDLTEYRQMLKSYPYLINEINNRNLNIEYKTEIEKNTLYGILKLNGHLVRSLPENGDLLNFVSRLVQRVANFKEKDFHNDPDQHLMAETREGLIYNDYIGNYLDGTGGRLDILEGTDLTEMFDFYFNDENAELDEKEEEMVFNAGDAITSILHEPAYVHNKAVHLDALIKEYLKIKEYYS